jgi:hypothetical protein
MIFQAALSHSEFAEILPASRTNLTQFRSRLWNALHAKEIQWKAMTARPFVQAPIGELRAPMERHGFRVEQVQIEHIFPYRIQDYVQYRYIKELYFRWMPEPLFRVLEWMLGWHLCVTAEVQ